MTPISWVEPIQSSRMKTSPGPPTCCDGSAYSSPAAIGPMLNSSLTTSPLFPPTQLFFQPSPDPSPDYLDFLTGPFQSLRRHCGLPWLPRFRHPMPTKQVQLTTAATLKLVGFNEQHNTVATRYTISLTICGESRATQNDVCVIYPPPPSYSCSSEDKTLLNKTSADGQVVGCKGS